MKILILSDSHGRIGNMCAVLDRIASGLDMVIHLGDNVSDADNLKELYKSLTFHVVSGNCDYSDEYEREGIIKASGRKIFFTHGHNHNVKSSPQRLVYAAREKEADICLYGHTHIPAIFASDSIMFMNPGSISIPRDAGVPCYGIISIEKGDSYISVVDVKSSGFEVRYSMPL